MHCSGLTLEVPTARSSVSALELSHTGWRWRCLRLRPPAWLGGESRHNNSVKTMSSVSAYRRVSNIARGVWSGFLWKRLHPTTFSRTGLRLTLSSLSDWDIFSEIWLSGDYDEPI